MNAPYFVLGNDIYTRMGHLYTSINYAPNNDKAGMAKKVCRLLCMEHMLQHNGERHINIQGIEGERRG